MNNFKIFDTIETYSPVAYKLKGIKYRGFLMFKTTHNEYRSFDTSVCDIVEILYSPKRIIKQNNVGMKTCRMVLSEKVNLDIQMYFNDFCI